MASSSIKGMYPVKFAKIDTAASGATAIVAAVTNWIIRVVAFYMVAGGAVSVKWQSASTDLTGAMGLAANGGVSADSHTGLFETAPSAALNLSLGGAVQVSGSCAYVLLPVKGLVAAKDLA